MPRASEVRPQKWSEIRVLFDDGNYSVIAGLYEGDLSLGERWNGSAPGSLGFPNQAGNPVWHVVPEFLERPLLHGLLDGLTKHPTAENREYAVAVIRELEDLGE